MANTTPANTTPARTAAVTTTPVSAAAVTDIDAGTTVIEESVVAKIAGIAARDVAGVYSLGGGAARVIGRLRDATNNTDLTQGVSVEVGETAVDATITIVVNYPQPLHTVAANVRTSVSSAITELVGMQVVKVDVIVDDIHFAADDEDDESTSTGQVTAKVDSTKAAVNARLDDAKTSATATLDDAKAAVSSRVDDAKVAVSERVDQASDSRTV